MRSPFPAWIPKVFKRESDRANVVPAHIRVLGTSLNKDTRTYIRQKLSQTLGKFAQSIERVTVRVKDVNGSARRYRPTLPDQSSPAQSSQRTG